MILSIPYKGSRDYLHGTDMFDRVISIASKESGGAPEVFEISFHAMANKPLVLQIGGDGPARATTAAGYFQGAAGKVRFFLSETDGEVVGRIPYAEEEVVRNMVFADQGATALMGALNPFSDIEVWIPMVKELHTRLFPEANGKWVFARAKMSGYSPEHAPMEYRVQHTAKLGHKLTRNEVFLGDRKVGDIFFSLM
ncbi:hypothetical protein [Maritalea sp.]|uniref:hypothetical protein n=1 Tax=Maritalea sp. TaxID=2003361 RepID=UPI003EF0C987